VKQGVPGRTHKAYFPIVHTYSSTNFVSFMSYLGNVYSTVKCSLDYELLCQVHELEVVESNCCQYRTFYFYNCKYVSSSSYYYYYYLFFGKTYCL